MEKQNIAFFSSDYRYLYKADIFRVLSLPTDSVIQFRYRREWIHNDVLNNLSSLKGKTATIFFTIGNDPNIPEDKRVLVDSSIREALIVDYKECDSTDLVLFFLQLKDFVNHKIDPSTPEEKLPKKKKYVSQLKITGNSEKWYQVVDRVKDAFGSTLFFNIKSINKKPKHLWDKLINRLNDSYKCTLCFNLKSIKCNPFFKTKDGDLIEPQYNFETKQSTYDLPDETEYIIDVLFYDFSKGKNVLKISDNHQLITINAESVIFVGAPKDNRIIPIETRAIDLQKQASVMSFTTEATTNEDLEKRYNILLPINIKRGFLKPLWYGLWTMVAFTALVITTYAGAIAKDSTELSKFIVIFGISVNKVIFLLVLAVLLAGFAASQLYKLFNKK